MKVLLVTSWGEQLCGIAEHSKMLIAALKEADADIEIVPSAEHLNPDVCDWKGVESAKIIHLNFHRALHSRWQPDEVRRLQSYGYKVVITFHDTFGELPPDQLSRDLCELADAFIVHEPCIGLEKATYWRMGVPSYDGAEMDPNYYRSRLVLGTVGFDFPWKNYIELANLTADIGWGFCVCCPEMNEQRRQELRTLNPWLTIHIGVNADMVVAALRGCDTTAFMYTCGNSGQSAAILQGIAARKPVYALRTCRQFRALYDNPIARSAIRWVDDFRTLKERLLMDSFPRLDPQMVQLTEQDSWRALGLKYAALYRKVLA